MPDSTIDGTRSGGYGGRPMKPLLTTIALLAMLGGARVAAAQDLVDIQVVAAGMSVAGVEVYVLALGEPFLVGETDAEGVVAAPADLVGLEPGDRLEVHQVVCAAERAVLLVPSDESAEDECARRRDEDPTCGCGPLGGARWGGRVSVDLVAETPMADVAPDEEPGEEPRDEPEGYDEPGVGGILWTAAAGAGWSSWPNLDKACNAEPGARTCELDAEAPTFRAALEARRPGFPLSLMAAFGYTTGLAVDQTFDATTNPLDPRRNVAELDVFTFEGYGVGRFAATPTVGIFAALGYVWAHDRIEATTTYGVEGPGVDDRSSSGGRFGARAGADWWPDGRSWGLRFEAGGMTGDEDNIDAAWSAGAMLLVPLGGR